MLRQKFSEQVEKIKKSVIASVNILITEELTDIQNFTPINTISIGYDLKRKDTIDNIKSIILDNIIRPFIHKNEYYGLNINSIDDIENLEIKLKLINFITVEPIFIIFILIDILYILLRTCIINIMAQSFFMIIIINS